MPTSIFSEHITRIAKQHDLKPLYLQEIIWHHIRGYNGIEISRHISVDRNTVNKYLAELLRMNKNEVSVLYFSVIVLKSSNEVIAQIKKDLTT